MSVSLEDHLETRSATPELRAVAETLLQLSQAAITVHRAIAAGRIPDGKQAEDTSNASGEVQKPLDVFADDTFLSAARASPVAIYGSEEQDEPVVIGKTGLALAIDPLDGSSNIETNIAVGTIFSLLPGELADPANPRSAFEQPGEKQLAAGFFMYGAQLLLVVTTGSGTQTFLYDPEQAGFVMICDGHSIPPETREYSVNASNRRHWDSQVSRYIEDAEAGDEGPRGRNFGMRYAGSLVAETYRILRRGGVFLYPGDRRKGYEKGRLRQIYEANPIAFCIEQAGGAATDGRDRMLERHPEGLHGRTAFVFGSKNEVEIIAAYAEEAA